MDLLSLLRGRFIRVGLSAPHKEAAIELLLDALIEDGGVEATYRDEYLEAILTRERRLSTGLECGVAIPHGTTERVEVEVAALGIFPGGVDFEAVDGATTKIVILLVTPLRRRDRHVINLAGIAKQLLCGTLLGSLLAAQSVEEVVAAIEAQAPESLTDPVRGASRSDGS